MAMVYGTQRTKRKEKNEAAELRRAETREKIGEGSKGREKKLKREGQRETEKKNEEGGGQRKEKGRINKGISIFMLLLGF